MLRTAADDTLVEQVWNYYDGANQWIRQKIDPDGETGSADIEQTVFVHEQGQIVLQFDKTGSGDLALSDLSHRYLWGPIVDQLFADERVESLTNASLNETLWALTDHKGTVRDVVDSAGNVVDHLVYDTAGNLLSQTDSDYELLFKYNGKPYDEAAGAYWMQARWYDPATGRWLSQDPIGFAAGDANLYRYVGNGPTEYVDPSGLKIVTDSDIGYIFDRYKIPYTVQRGSPNVYSYRGPRGHLTKGVFRFQQQVLAQMLKSPTLFRIAGTSVAAEHRNLKEHVMARQRIALNAGRKKFVFDCDEHVHHTIQPIPDQDSDPQEYFESINNPNTRVACLNGTRSVFYGGIGSMDEYDTRPHDDVWIPGDWGYIFNFANPEDQEPAQDGWPAGLEGENIIYLGIDINGNERFWGHFGPGNTWYTLPEWKREIRRWRSSQGDPGDPVVRPTVDYPRVGLE